MTFKQNPIKELKFLETSVTYSIFFKGLAREKKYICRSGGFDIGINSARLLQNIIKK